MSSAEYTRIIDHYRTAILEGKLPLGSRLPTVAALADHWGVAKATINRAMGHLVVEGYVRTSPRGTFVTDDPPGVLVGIHRMTRVQRDQPYLVDGETARILRADMIRAPHYVADILDLDDDARALRRVFVVGRADRVLMLVSDWYPATAATTAPGLLAQSHDYTDGAANRGRSEYLAAAGPVTDSRDDMEARDATVFEAAQLHIAPGSACLAVVSRWWNGAATIAYSEAVLPPKTVIGYRLDGAQ